MNPSKWITLIRMCIKTIKLWPNMFLAKMHHGVIVNVCVLLSHNQIFSHTVHILSWWSNWGSSCRWKLQKCSSCESCNFDCGEKMNVTFISTTRPCDIAAPTYSISEWKPSYYKGKQTVAVDGSSIKLFFCTVRKEAWNNSLLSPFQIPTFPDVVENDQTSLGQINKNNTFSASLKDLWISHHAARSKNPNKNVYLLPWWLLILWSLISTVLWL